MTLKTYSSVEAQQNFEQLLDEVQHQPVVITQHNRDFAVVISQQTMLKLTNLFSDYFKEQIEKGTMNFMEALEMQLTMLKDAEEAMEEYKRGEYYEVTPQFIEEIRQSIPRNV